EDALYSHPAIMDAAVVGIPHRVLGEEVGAVVQVKPGVAANEAALRRHVAAQLAAFKVPVRIVLRDEPLPRNAHGKILKRELRSRFGGRRGRLATARTRGADEITDVIERRREGFGDRLSTAATVRENFSLPSTAREWR